MMEEAQARSVISDVLSRPLSLRGTCMSKREPLESNRVVNERELTFGSGLARIRVVESD